jgi:hypothetical protein
MIKKLGNKALLLILVLLLAVFAIARYISNKRGENTFQTSIVPKIDSARMNGMVIFQKATKKGKPLPYIFTRKGKDWYVSQGNVVSRAEPRAARYMISQLETISPDRLASNDPKDWKDLCVNDSLGTRVVFLYDKDTAIDLIVGRFSYMPKEKKSMSCVRLSGHDEVYAVEGFLSMNITEDFDAWRDKKIMPGDYNTWNKLTFTYPHDSGFVLMNGKDDRWVFGDGSKPDSLAAVNLIKQISNQNYGSFVNNFDSSGKQPVFTLQIEGAGFGPIVIKAFPADTANIYAINSTINPGSFFSGKQGGLVNKIFPGKAAFFRKDFKPLPAQIKPKTEIRRR